MYNSYIHYRVKNNVKSKPEPIAIISTSSLHKISAHSGSCYIEKVEKKGRVLSKIGMQKLDKLATEILQELSKEKPELKIYS